MSTASTVQVQEDSSSDSLVSAAYDAIKLTAAAIVARDADKAMVAASVAKVAVWSVVAKFGKDAGYMIVLTTAVAKAAKALKAAQSAAAMPIHAEAETMAKHFAARYIEPDQLSSHKPVHVVVGAAVAAVIAAVTAMGSAGKKAASDVMIAAQMVMTRRETVMKDVGAAMVAASEAMRAASAADHSAADHSAVLAPHASRSNAVAAKALMAAAKAVLAAYKIKGGDGSAGRNAGKTFENQYAYERAVRGAQMGDTAAMHEGARARGSYVGISAIAARNGHTETMLAAAVDGCRIDLDAAQAAAYGGHTETMLEAIRAGSSRNANITRDAAAAGHRDTLVAAIEAGCPLNPLAAEYAAQGGHTKLMIELVEKYHCEWGRAVVLAEQYGQYDTMQAAIARGAPRTK